MRSELLRPSARKWRAVWIAQRVKPSRKGHPGISFDVSFQTDPSGLVVQAAGADITGPATITGWVGWSLPVSAPDQADGGGTQYEFLSWSDGGAATHTITLPAQASTYTA